MGLKDYFTFGGENCSDYGVHASGQSTFDAPVKEYESYSIPGRSGDLKIFDGRYSNIKVTYPCVYDKVGNDFSKDIAGLRNALLCKDGYQRLWDSHHPDEYRLGIYEGGLEVDPTSHGLKATFDVDFDCKPQRYLTSGEVAVPVANNGKITNPTRFPSSPLLEVTGYGTIDIAGQKISIANLPIGKTQLIGISQDNSSDPLVEQYLTKAFHKTILHEDKGTVSIEWHANFTIEGAVAGTITREQSSATDGMIAACLVSETGDIEFDCFISNLEFPAGRVIDKTFLAIYLFTYEDSNGDQQTAQIHFSGQLHFYSDHAELDALTISTPGSGGPTISLTRNIKQFVGGFVYSTMSMLGEPMYVDLDTGNAYKIEDDEYVLVNHGINIGTEIPVLRPGVNKIKYSNTVTDLKIVPRWWRL